jgi:hypothetical protein
MAINQTRGPLHKKNSPGKFLVWPTTKATILWRRLILACTTVELLQNLSKAKGILACTTVELLQNLSKAKGIKNLNFFHTRDAPKVISVLMYLFWQSISSFAYAWFVSHCSCAAATVMFIHGFFNVFVWHL